MTLSEMFEGMTPAGGNDGVGTGDAGATEGAASGEGEGLATCCAFAPPPASTHASARIVTALTFTSHQKPGVAFRHTVACFLESEQ